jgi:hypothetical protein
LADQVLIIPDLHEPCTHPGAFDFICRVRDLVCPSRIVFIGDVVDWHGVNFHAKHPSGPGPKDEYMLALEGVQRWYREFPEAEVMIGNHDERPIRMAEANAIPGALLRDYAEVWQTPGWDWKFETRIDGVYYFHGTGRSGINPAANVMKDMGMSVVMGHVHSVAGCKWGASPEERRFGMDVGCLVDDRLYAFAYGRHCKKKSVLGCGFVDGDNPMRTQFIPMPCGRGEEFDRAKYPAHPLLK